MKVDRAGGQSGQSGDFGKREFGQSFSRDHRQCGVDELTPTQGLGFGPGSWGLGGFWSLRSHAFRPVSETETRPKPAKFQ